jgi:hypothetical protein
MSAPSWTLLLLGVLGGGSGTQPAIARPPPAATARALAALKVTEGALIGSGAGPFRVEAPKVRAVLREETAQDVALDFVYLGPTAKQLPLGSGALRQQVALKLVAQDGCNLLYVTWRFAPKNAVVVSVKRNPGQATSAECGNRGYLNVRPSQAAPPPVPEVGSHHVLRAGLESEMLRVWIDGREVWRGAPGPRALGLKGPVGVRTDNVRISFSLLAPP